MLPRALPALLAVCLLPLACTVTTTHADDNEPKPNTGGDSNDAQPAEPEPALGQGFAGRLAPMSEAQIRELQAQLGLDATMPVLATTEQWTSFCSDERGSEALTRITAKAEGDSGGR